MSDPPVARQASLPQTGGRTPDLRALWRCQLSAERRRRGQFGTPSRPATYLKVLVGKDTEAHSLGDALSSNPAETEAELRTESTRYKNLLKPPSSVSMKQLSSHGTNGANV